MTMKMKIKMEMKMEIKIEMKMEMVKHRRLIKVAKKGQEV